MKHIFRLLMLVLLLVAALMTVARRDSSGAWIAFVRTQDRVPHIHLMSGDGGSVRQITVDEVCADAPRWSPDGGWLAFLIPCGATRVQRIRPGSAHPQPVNDELHYMEDLNWSPDGEWLLFMNAGPSIYSVKASGGRENLLGHGLYLPQWSPDGAWVYAQFWGNALQRIHIESGREEPIPHAGIGPNGMTWSPDGERIAFIQRQQGKDDIVLMAPDDSSVQPIPLDLPRLRFFEPRWSPNGEWIAFLGGAAYYELHVYRARPDDGHVQQLSTQAGRVSDLQWSGDNTWLLFSADYDDGSAIYRLRADGSAMEHLAPGFDPQVAPVAGLGWRPFGVTVAAVILLAASVWGRLR